MKQAPLNLCTRIVCRRSAGVRFFSSTGAANASKEFPGEKKPDIEVKKEVVPNFVITSRSLRRKKRNSVLLTMIVQRWKSPETTLLPKRTKNPRQFHTIQVEMK